MTRISIFIAFVFKRNTFFLWGEGLFSLKRGEIYNKMQCISLICKKIRRLSHRSRKSCSLFTAALMAFSFFFSPGTERKMADVLLHLFIPTKIERNKSTCLSVVKNKKKREKCCWLACTTVKKWKPSWSCRVTAGAFSNWAVGNDIILANAMPVIRFSCVI